jgi:hypothetical protein
MIMKHLVFTHYLTKALFFGTNVQFVFVIDFEIVVMNMTMTFYGLNMHPYMELIQMKKI